MKNKILFCTAIIAACLFSMRAFAQLNVSSNGNVTMPKNVAIGDSVPSNVMGLRVEVSTDGLLNYGISSVNSYRYEFLQMDGCHVGVLGKISSHQYIPPFFPKEIVQPYPFDAGVAGLSSSGCGIYGSTSTTLPDTWNLGTFAGYFAGDVKVTGALTASSINNNSDARFKDNVEDLQESAIDKLRSLRPVSYTFKPDSMIYLKEGEEKRTHYGVIAQEMKEIFPDLVSEDGAGYLSVNYIELIPLLIQAVKQQQVQIDELQSMLPAQAQNNIKRNMPAAQSDAPRLMQNTPNPFSQNTIIGYFLPTDTREAAIRVYDMSGAEIAVYPIVSFGQGELTINGGTFRAGMYLYSLIADGQLIDTKQMILTK